MAAQFNQPSDIVCVTWYNDSPLLDERAYARTTAGRVGAELIEYKLRPEKFIKREAYDRFEFSPLPFSANYEMERAPFLAKVMQERDLSAVYYGNAGDGLFFSSGDNLALIDYFISCGLGRKTFSVALSSAQVSETSLLRSFWVAIMAKAGYFSEQTSRDPDYGWGLCREFKNNIDAEEKYFAPWEWPHAKVPHGKRTQIWGVMGESQYMNLLTGVPPLPVVELFLAQPLVEVCLQIPTYILQFNGRERGLARRAFKDCLSREVKLRRFKSHLSDYADDHVRTNAAMLKEYLLDGVLARNGILDKLVIEQFFNAPAQASEIHFARITHLVDTEAWARRWY